MGKKIWQCLGSKSGLAVCLITVILCALVAGWNFYAAPLQEGEVYQYTKYNDTYQEPLATGPGSWQLTQNLTLQPDQKVYGLRLLFSTGGVSCQGSFEARLETQDGQVLATTGVVNAAALLDGDFQGLPFVGEQGFFQDNPHVSGAEHSQVVLHLIYTDGSQGTTPLALWYGADVAGEITLEGQSLPGSLALQLMTENATGWSAKMGLVLVVPLLAGVAVALLAAMARWKLAVAAVATGLFLGLSFALVTPVQVAPDEYAHIAACYEQVSALSGQATLTQGEQGDTILVRDCDSQYISAVTGEIGPAAYKHLLVELPQTGQSGQLTTPKALRLTQTQTWYLFLPQLAGVALARALGLSFYGLVLLGRLCNLLVYLALVFLALNRAPGSAKGVLAGVALLPMSLQLAASFSPDAMTLGLSFCVAALCLAGYRRPLALGEWAGLTLLAFLLVPAKIIYLPMVALCGVIPARHIRPGRQGQGMKALVFLAGLAGMAVFSGDYLGYIFRDVDDVFLGRILWMGVLPALLAALWGLWFTRKDPGRRRLFWRILACGVVLGTMAGVAVLSQGKYPMTQEELANSIQPNGDSKYFFTVGYILHHLPATVKVIWNSLLTSSGEWLQGLLGTSLGEPIVYPIQVNGLLGLALALVLVLWALRTGEESPRLGTQWHSRLPLGVAGAVFVLCLAACLTWTPINYTVLFGVQGRYFLPVLPLVLLWVGDRPLLTLQKAGRRWLLPAQTVLVFLVLCQGFLLYCQGA